MNKNTEHPFRVKDCNEKPNNVQSTFDDDSVFIIPAGQNPNGQKLTVAELIVSKPG